MSRVSNIIIKGGSQLQFNQAQASFKYTFPQPHSSVNEKIALKALSIYYSWNNLTATFNNLTGCSYVWPGTGLTYAVNFPAGFYTGVDINNYIQLIMKGNGHYLLDSVSNEVYYLSLTINPVVYGYTLVVTPVPTSLPVNYSNPGGMTFPASALTPQLITSPSTNWYQLIGFSPATYPPSLADTTRYYNSTLIPIASPITQIQVLCDWVNDSRFDMNSSCISSFVPDVQFGALISFLPPVLTFYDVDQRVYSSVTVRLTDQNGTPLVIKDYSQAIFTLLVM